MEKQQKILVIGASSYVGARLYQELIDSKFLTIGTYNRHCIFDDLIQLDISDAALVEKIVTKQMPDILLPL